MIHDEILHAACAQLGLPDHPSELIRLAENAIYRLPGGVVARISRPGQIAAARREVMVSAWLTAQDFPVVRALTDLPQPVEIEECAVTFWQELPPHTTGTFSDIGGLLRRLHALPARGITLPPLDPFVQVEERIAHLTFLSDDDRDWMLHRAAELRDAYTRLPPGLPHGLVHGDPWRGNVARTPAGPVLLDLERFSLGAPEYDLVVIAASHTSYGMLDRERYQDLVAAYGHDVTVWDGYPVLRDIRELRVTTYAGQVALDHPTAKTQAVHRLRCLRGEYGPRPWPGWHNVP